MSPPNTLLPHRGLESMRREKGTGAVCSPHTPPTFHQGWKPFPESPLTSTYVSLARTGSHAHPFTNHHKGEQGCHDLFRGIDPAWRRAWPWTPGDVLRRPLEAGNPIWTCLGFLACKRAAVYPLGHSLLTQEIGTHVTIQGPCSRPG